jgi:hypothetical protein
MKCWEFDGTGHLSVLLTTPALASEVLCEVYFLLHAACFDRVPLLAIGTLQALHAFIEKM